MNELITDLINNNGDRIIRFAETLQAESDRGCALVSAAYLDESLKQLLLKSFVEDKLSEKILEHELQPFSLRIDIAFLLGALNKIAHRDLHLIRKIRNEFGHNADPITFEHPQIKDRCLELKYSRDNADQTPRLRFISATCTLLGSIDAIAIQKKHPPIRTTHPPDESLRKICGQGEGVDPII